MLHRHIIIYWSLDYWFYATCWTSCNHNNRTWNRLISFPLAPNFPLRLRRKTCIGTWEAKSCQRLGGSWTSVSNFLRYVFWHFGWFIQVDLIFLFHFFWKNDPFYSGWIKVSTKPLGIWKKMWFKVKRPLIWFAQIVKKPSVMQRVLLEGGLLGMRIQWWSHWCLLVLQRRWML